MAFAVKNGNDDVNWDSCRNFSLSSCQNFMASMMPLRFINAIFAVDACCVQWSGDIHPCNAVSCSVKHVLHNPSACAHASHRLWLCLWRNEKKMFPLHLSVLFRCFTIASHTSLETPHLFTFAGPIPFVSQMCGEPSGVYLKRALNRPKRSWLSASFLMSAAFGVTDFGLFAIFENLWFENEISFRSFPNRIETFNCLLTYLTNKLDARLLQSMTINSFALNKFSAGNTNLWTVAKNLTRTWELIAVTLMHETLAWNAKQIKISGWN